MKQISCPASNLGKEDGLETELITNANDLTNSFLGNGTSTETPKQRGLESFWMMNTLRYWEGGGPRAGMETSHTLPYVYLPFGCF